MKEIPLLSRSGIVRAITIVDDEDFETFSRWTWRLMPVRPYAVRFDAMLNRQRYLHREILGLAYGDPIQADHIDLDKLNNRRENLRRVTRAQQAQNQPSRGGTSPFRGVCWDTNKGRWKATAGLDGRVHNLGHFDLEADAARVAADWRAEHMPFSQEALAS